MVLKKLARLAFYIMIIDLYIITYSFDTHLFNIGKYDSIGFPFDNSFGRFKYSSFYIFLFIFTYDSLIKV